MKVGLCGFGQDRCREGGAVSMIERVVLSSQSGRGCIRHKTSTPRSESTESGPQAKESTAIDSYSTRHAQNVSTWGKQNSSQGHVLLVSSCSNDAQHYPAFPFKFSTNLEFTNYGTLSRHVLSHGAHLFVATLLKSASPSPHPSAICPSSLQRSFSKIS